MHELDWVQWETPDGTVRVSKGFLKANAERIAELKAHISKMLSDLLEKRKKTCMKEMIEEPRRDTMGCHSALW